MEIPVYGFGTYQIPADGSTYQAVQQALALGIRHIDTAAAYFNEHEVGKAMEEAKQAGRHHKSASQIILRFEAQQGAISPLCDKKGADLP